MLGGRGKGGAPRENLAETWHASSSAKVLTILP